MYFRSKCTHVTNSLVPRKSIMCKHMPTSLSKSFESFEKRKVLNWRSLAIDYQVLEHFICSFVRYHENWMKTFPVLAKEKLCWFFWKVKIIRGLSAENLKFFIYVKIWHIELLFWVSTLFQMIISISWYFKTISNITIHVEPSNQQTHFTGEEILMLST